MAKAKGLTADLDNPSLTTASSETPDYLRDSFLENPSDFRDSFIESSYSAENNENLEEFDDENSHFDTVNGSPFDTSDLEARTPGKYDEYDEKLVYANRAKQYKQDAHIRRTRSILAIFGYWILSYFKLRRVYFSILSFLMVISIIFGLAEWQPRNEKLTNSLRLKMVELKALEIHNEKDPLVKLKALDRELNSGGTLSYTSLRDDDKNLSDRHLYILDYNFADDYVTAVKDLDEGYKNGLHTGVDAATLLEKLYLNGNVFVENDLEKHKYYFYQKKAFDEVLSGK